MLLIYLFISISRKAGLQSRPPRTGEPNPNTIALPIRETIQPVPSVPVRSVAVKIAFVAPVSRVRAIHLAMEILAVGVERNIPNVNNFELICTYY